MSNNLIDGICRAWYAIFPVLFIISPFLLIIGFGIFEGHQPEQYGPEIPAHEILCSQRGGTWFQREYKCIAVKEIKL